VVEIDVRDSGDASVPGMRGVESTSQSDLHERDIEPGFSEVPEDDRGQKLELGGFAVTPRDGVRDTQDGFDVTRELGRVDGATIHLHTLAIRHEVGLRGLADTQSGRSKGASGEGKDAALAVRAPDERATHLELGVSERV